MRSKYIRIVDGWLKANKRAYPDNNSCELCNKEQRLYYHHWDNSNPDKGVWVCNACHRLVEAFESGRYEEIIEKYIPIKQDIEFVITENRVCYN